MCVQLREVYVGLNQCQPTYVNLCTAESAGIKWKDMNVQSVAPPPPARLPLPSVMDGGDLHSTPAGMVIKCVLRPHGER